MLNLCNELHDLLRSGLRFDFNTGYEQICKNGIYIMFEKVNWVMVVIVSYALERIQVTLN